MISTGMYGLDDMLGGGIPEGSRVLYSMEPGVNGQLFMISVLSSALAEKRSCLVILPHTTVDAFLHDADTMLAGRIGLGTEKIAFFDSVDRERIQKATRSPKAAGHEWQARISKICKENAVDVIFAYFDLMYEDFGANALKILESGRDDIRPTIILEHLNLEGPSLTKRFIEEYSFDLVLSIRSSIHPLPHFNYFTLIHSSWIANPTRSVPFIIAEGRIVPYIPRIVVTGPAKSGKSTFVANASEHGISIDRAGPDGEATTVAMDLGWLRWKDFDITLYGTPGEPRFDPLIPHALRHAMGVVLVLDVSRPETLSRARDLIKIVKQQKIPLVIAANTRDRRTPLTREEIRKAVGVKKDIPVIFISATSQSDVSHVLESLIDFITQVAY